MSPTLLHLEIASSILRERIYRVPEFVDPHSNSVTLAGEWCDLNQDKSDKPLQSTDHNFFCNQTGAEEADFDTNNT